MKQKETHRHRGQTCGCPRGWGREALEVWDEQMQTIIYRMDKEQGPTAEHRDLHSIPCNKP